MLLLTQSNSFLASGLPLLILFPPCPRLRDMLYLCLKCTNYFWIHDILDKAVSKQVENSACILAHLFNSVSRQHHEVWASQFPFLHSLKEVIPPSEACLYGHINWSLAQAHSVGFSQSFILRGVARPDHRLGSNSQYRRDLCQVLCQGLLGHLCLRGLSWSVGMRLI